MTDDFDVSLRRRLEGLSASVPISAPGEIASVRPRHIRAGSGARLGWAGWLPVLALVVGGALVAGIAQLGPSTGQPRSSKSQGAEPSNGPVEASARSGDFSLTIRSAKSAYESGELIDISTWYAYGSGAGDTVVVSHFFPEVEFGVEELSPDTHRVPRTITDSACVEETLSDGVNRGVTMTDASLTYVMATEWPETAGVGIGGSLRLPPGQWRITAWLRTALGSCADPRERQDASASIEVAVGPEPDASRAPRAPSEAPQATRPPESPPPRNGSGRDQAERSGMSISVFTPRSRVHLGDRVSIFTDYRFTGRRESVQIHYLGPPVVFKIKQLDATAPSTFSPDGLTPSCTSRELFAGDESVAFGEVGQVSGDGVGEDWLSSNFDGSKLRLPLGRWRVSAVLIASIGDCEGGEPTNLPEVSVDIEVVPVDAGGIELLRGSTPPTIDDECPINAVSGMLAPNPVSGLGLLLDSGQPVPVRWPVDFSAEQGFAGAVLYDWNGFRFATEGQLLNLSGNLGADGVFSMCFPLVQALVDPTT
jgi:hypothetical protein